MSKDLNWLKNRLEWLVKINNMDSSSFSATKREAYNDALDLVNQLDDSEVSLQMSPVIPRFVADFLIGKEDYMLYELFDDEWLYKEHDRVAKWLYDSDKETNKERELNLILAHYGEYTVEEEQKYYVIFPSMDKISKGFNYLAKDTYHNELWVEDSRTDGLDWEERSSFTEDEIRDLDKGDILFEHFAVKVKELEV